MGSKPLFLGVYMAPGVFIGSDLALYRAYLDHLRAMARPNTGEAHQIVRAWAMVQWRLQCLAELERDWWTSFEQGILLTEPAGEESVLDTDPLERMQVCQRAVNSWDKLQRMERRLKREAAALLPLLGALIADAMVSENTQPDPVAVGECSTGEKSHLTLADASGAISCADRRQNCFDQNTPTPIGFGGWGEAPSAGILRGATPLSRGAGGGKPPENRCDSVLNSG